MLKLAVFAGVFFQLTTQTTIVDDDELFAQNRTSGDWHWPTYAEVFSGCVFPDYSVGLHRPYSTVVLPQGLKTGASTAAAIVDRHCAFDQLNCYVGMRSLGETMRLDQPIVQSQVKKSKGMFGDAYPFDGWTGRSTIDPFIHSAVPGSNEQILTVVRDPAERVIAAWETYRNSRGIFDLDLGDFIEKAYYDEDFRLKLESPRFAALDAISRELVGKGFPYGTKGFAEKFGEEVFQKVLGGDWLLMVADRFEESVYMYMKKGYGFDWEDLIHMIPDYKSAEELTSTLTSRQIDMLRELQPYDYILYEAAVIVLDMWQYRTENYMEQNVYYFDDDNYDDDNSIRRLNHLNEEYGTRNLNHINNTSHNTTDNSTNNATDDPNYAIDANDDYTNYYRPNDDYANDDNYANNSTNNATDDDYANNSTNNATDDDYIDDADDNDDDYDYTDYPCTYARYYSAWSNGTYLSYSENEDRYNDNYYSTGGFYRMSDESCYLEYVNDYIKDTCTNDGVAAAEHVTRKDNNLLTEDHGHLETAKRGMQLPEEKAPRSFMTFSKSAAAFIENLEKMEEKSVGLEDKEETASIKFSKRFFDLTAQAKDGFETRRQQAKAASTAARSSSSKMHKDNLGVAKSYFYDDLDAFETKMCEFYELNHHKMMSWSRTYRNMKYPEEMDYYVDNEILNDYIDY